MNVCVCVFKMIWGKKKGSLWRQRFETAARLGYCQFEILWVCEAEP